MIVFVLVLLVLGVQVGRSLANAAAGTGWVFVDRLHLFTSVAGVVSGDAGAGLTGPAGVPGPARTAGTAGRAGTAGPGLLWAGIGVVELVLLTGCVAAVKHGWDRWGPTRMQGMATRAQAEALLGRTRLRQHAPVIRPDLYGARPGPARRRDRGHQSRADHPVGNHPGDHPGNHPGDRLGDDVGDHRIRGHRDGGPRPGKARVQ
ncbi:hypothetical protein V3N99_08270 [Dermatophilaceae bacterium Soc4.6]